MSYTRFPSGWVARKVGIVGVGVGRVRGIGSKTGKVGRWEGLDG